MSVSKTLSGGGGGGVGGPADVTSTDNAVARWDGTGGVTLQNSVVTISDAGVVAGVTQLNVDNLRLDGNTLSSTDSNGNITLTPDGTGVVVSVNHAQFGGQKYLAADGTNATVTMADTGLSVAVTTGRKYAFNMILMFSTDVAADGLKIDFDGGSAAATNFRAFVRAEDAGAPLVLTSVTALATDVTVASTTDTNPVLVHATGSFEPSGTGTFIPRYAQNAHTTGTLTLLRGSHLIVWDCP